MRRFPAGYDKARGDICLSITRKSQNTIATCWMCLNLCLQYLDVLQFRINVVALWLSVTPFRLFKLQDTCYDLCVCFVINKWTQCARLTIVSPLKYFLWPAKFPPVVVFSHFETYLFQIIYTMHSELFPQIAHYPGITISYSFLGPTLVHVSWWFPPAF